MCFQPQMFQQGKGEPVDIEKYLWGRRYAEKKLSPERVKEVRIEILQAMPKGDLLDRLQIEWPDEWAEVQKKEE